MLTIIDKYFRTNKSELQNTLTRLDSVSLHTKHRVGNRMIKDQRYKAIFVPVAGAAFPFLVELFSLAFSTAFRILTVLFFGHSLYGLAWRGVANRVLAQPRLFTPIHFFKPGDAFRWWSCLRGKPVCAVVGCRALTGPATLVQFPAYNVCRHRYCRWVVAGFGERTDLPDS